MPSFKILLALLLTLFMSSFVLVPSAYAQQSCAANDAACLALLNQSASDSNDGAIILGAAIAGGIVYFIARDKPEKEKLRLISNYLQGNGIRLSGDRSDFSVDMLSVRSPIWESFGFAGNAFTNRGGHAIYGIDLVKIRY